jgi:hypothetical protein
MTCHHGKPDGCAACEEIAEGDRLIANLRIERNFLQKVCARRAAMLEHAGLHADCTLEEAKAMAEEIAALRAALAAERERCARVCEEAICACCWDDDAQAAAEHCADEIRSGS